jgi:hypothetical protein
MIRAVLPWHLRGLAGGVVPVSIERPGIALGERFVLHRAPAACSRNIAKVSNVREHLPLARNDPGSPNVR